MLNSSPPARRTVLVANPSADLYGSDRMMLESVRGYRDRGWRVVVAHSSDGPLVDRLTEIGADVVGCPAPVVRKANLTPRGVLELGGDVVRGLTPMRRLVKEVKPDLLYVSTVTIPLWLAVGRSMGIPTVLHVHEAEASVPTVVRVGLNLPSHLATRVIFNSATSKAVAHPRGALQRRCRVIHNGVAGPPTSRPARPVLEDGIRLAYVGRLSPRKGVDLAIEAVDQLVKAGNDVSLSLVGAVFPGYEWYEVELREQVAAAGLGDRVVFRGFRDSVWDELGAADIAIVPSRSDESFGNTVIEGVLAQRPVVAADHSGLAEARRGLRSVVPFENDNVASLADAVRRISADWDAFRAAATHDAAWAGETYSPHRFREGVVALSEEVMKSAPRDSATEKSRE